MNRDEIITFCVIGCVGVLLFGGLVVVFQEIPELHIEPQENLELNSSNVDVAMREIGSNSTHEFFVDCGDGVSPWDINSTNYNETRFTENCWVEAFSKSTETLDERDFR